MNPLDLAIKEAGGVSALAASIGVTQSAVSNWRSRPGPVPVEHCAAIERAAAVVVTRRDLRPDDWHRIWPELITPEHPAPEPATAQG